MTSAATPCVRLGTADGFAKPGGVRAREAPPLPDAGTRASVTPRRAASCRAGPPRCAGVGPEPGRCAAPPRPGSWVPHLLTPPTPRVKVKVSGPEEVSDWGAGPVRNLGTGAGRCRGHGWARPPPASQPETEARPWGLVLAGARRARGAGTEARESPRLPPGGRVPGRLARRHGCRSRFARESGGLSWAGGQVSWKEGAGG